MAMGSICAIAALLGIPDERSYHVLNAEEAERRLIL